MSLAFTNEQSGVLFAAQWPNVWPLCFHKNLHMQKNLLGCLYAYLNVCFQDDVGMFAHRHSSQVLR